MHPIHRLPDPLVARKAAYDIEPLFLKRWSPRAMNGGAVADEELYRLFEAARWAPSTYNEQEWLFLYARKRTSHWEVFFDLLVQANQAWCRQAAVLVCVLSRKTFERNGKPNPVHTFDTGAAFENLALQGAAMDLVIHAMAGFDYDKARSALRVPEDYRVEAMVAIGRPGEVASLPNDLQEHEQPSGRKSVVEIVQEGPFTK